MIKEIAIVKSAANKSSCTSFGESKYIYIPANKTKVRNVTKTTIGVWKNNHIYHAGFVYQ